MAFGQVGILGEFRTSKDIETNSTSSDDQEILPGGYGETFESKNSSVRLNESDIDRVSLIWLDKNHMSIGHF